MPTYLEILQNYKSDAEHVSPEFYNLIKNSTKNRRVNTQRKQQVSMAAIFNENT